MISISVITDAIEEYKRNEGFCDEQDDSYEEKSKSWLDKLFGNKEDDKYSCDEEFVY